MYTVTFTRSYTNTIIFQYPVINRASALSELIDHKNDGVLMEVE